MLSIGKVSQKTQLTVETIRYYEKEGLLPAASRTAAGYRQYNQASLQRIQFISRAKQLGFTLAEVRQLLHISDGQGGTADAKALTEQKLASISQKIIALQNIQTALKTLAADCPGHGDVCECPIINALAGDPI